ncbi:response regulator [Nocardia brasiliensis]|uniref:Two component system response regulator n=1 Tax=Nocardia brasiliensis (strain ATCC 700358 / HUJEG-1) TaxID=1133849 RepID=K0ERX2_NOCB7|nr:response regulator transcription factor [Nocardia brasiliensis]AFU02563.1 two component system response regulator [Nocardia brasiliensis ATCC 700358]OCF86515.1 LuxR family transcriptional regulator [Nocardia brasiliensis]
MTIRVLIADDQPLIRDGLSVLLNAQPDIEVVGEAADGVEAARLTADCRPDVVLMDIRMPRLDGLEATARIVASGAPTRVIVLTTYDLDEYVFRALRAGASGFLLKDASGLAIVDSVRTIALGDAMLAPSVTRRLLDEFARLPARPRPDAARLRALTDRETQVLTLIARGLSNAEIAETLGIAEETVKTHVGRILAKLRLRDRTQAAIAAYETGLVTPG